MTIRLPEVRVEGKRLGRHINHDPRSLRFLLAPAAPVSVAWDRHAPILDQGDVGSCTGNAMTGALATGPLYDALPHDRYVFDEKMALAIYSAAETVDGDGPYPPNDNGSSGLSVATVAKDAKLISGYLHATSVQAAYAAIAAGPFIVGTNWYSGMDTPDRIGRVHPTGTLRGGHEYLCRQYDASQDLFWFDNSWGTSYGVNGRFSYSSADLAKLLAEHGDITSFVPASAPAPTPAPGADRTLNAKDAGVLDAWAALHHTGGNAIAAAAWKHRV